MLCLALVGLFALSAPESHARIPGTGIRFGMLESQLLGLGAFLEVQAPDAAGATARRGPTKFFGIPGQATLYVRDGRLARMRFEAPGVSAHSMDYVEDQFRRMRMAPTCQRQTSGDQVCDWTGGTLKVRMQYGKEKLEARFEPLSPLRPVAADAARAVKPSAGAPVKPAVKPAVKPPGKPAVTATAPPAPAPGAASTATPAITTLPETLTISLATNNSPTEWPRIVSSPPLEYPEAARRESVQGVVWVLAFVDLDGTVSSAAVERGIPELDAAAITWVFRSRFAPCERRGAPCRFHVRVAVRFTLY